MFCFFFFFSSRRRHTRSDRDWSSDVCSSDLAVLGGPIGLEERIAILLIGADRAAEHGKQVRAGRIDRGEEIGRASCRERVESGGGGGVVKRKKGERGGRGATRRHRTSESKAV